MYILTSPLVVSFAGGASGGWRVDRIEGVRGSRLGEVPSLAVIEGSSAPIPPNASWVLRGVTSNERYVSRIEHDALGPVSKQGYDAQRRSSWSDIADRGGRDDWQGAG